MPQPRAPMSSLRARLAAHRERLITDSASLRGELVSDLASLRRKVDWVTRLVALVPIARPILSFALRRWRRR